MRRIREFGWRYPEWWALAAAAAAWVWLLIPVRDSHAHHGAQPAFGLASWTAMIVAMMLPLVVGPIRATATRSIWRRRNRAIALFITGYATPWMLLGLAVAMQVTLPGADSAASAPAAAGMAALWQVTPMKRYGLRTCHRTIPLAPIGWRADRDCLRYGWSIGSRCMLNCWPMMLVCVAAGHHFWVMAAVSAFMARERFSRGRIVWPTAELRVWLNRAACR